MTTLELFLHRSGGKVSRTIGSPFAPMWNAFSNAVAARLQAIEREAEYRRAERVLRSVPDSMLKDIGMSRGTIRNRVRGLPD